MAASTQLRFSNALDAAREDLNDDAQRRWPDTDLMNYVVPKVLAQLRADRPDLFVGSFTSMNLAPVIEDFLPFDDEGFFSFVEAIVASVLGQSEESVGRGKEAAADGKSERARKS
jgi:hypothetical protein